MRTKQQISVEVQVIVSNAGYSMVSSLLTPAIIDPVITQHALFRNKEEVVKLFLEAVGFDLTTMLRAEILDKLVKLLIEYQLLHLHDLIQ